MGSSVFRASSMDTIGFIRIILLHNNYFTNESHGELYHLSY